MKKSFFKKKSPAQMCDGLNMKRVYSPRNLAEKINELDKNEGIILQFPITPVRFRFPDIGSAESSRRNYKHGSLIAIDQPQTRTEAFDSPYIPLIGRMKAIESAMKDLKQEEINFLGIFWHPVQGRDKRFRVVPFDVPISGVEIDGYAQLMAGGIGVNDKYIDAKKVETEGARLLCSVPSRTKKEGRYHLNLVNVPIVPGKEANAIILGLKSQFEDGREPGRVTFLHHLRYESARSQRGSDIFVFGPHDVAAYLAVVRKYWKGLENTVPLVCNPFPIPSKEFAVFSKKLDNNVLMFDPTLSSKDKLRNIHLDEKCILLARDIKVRGVWNTIYWDARRDGKTKDYFK